MYVSGAKYVESVVISDNATIYEATAVLPPAVSNPNAIRGARAPARTELSCPLNDMAV